LDAAGAEGVVEVAGAAQTRDDEVKGPVQLGAAGDDDLAVVLHGHVIDRVLEGAEAEVAFAAAGGPEGGVERAAGGKAQQRSVGVLARVDAGGAGQDDLAVA